MKRFVVLATVFATVASGCMSSSAGPAPSHPNCASAPANRLIDVAGGPGLKAALATAIPGDLIRLAAGTYTGTFSLDRSGTPNARITICGLGGAVLQGSGTGSGYGLWLEQTSWITVANLTVRTYRKGIMLDDGDDIVLSHLLVSDIGDEGVHFRKGSSRNELSDSVIRDTGRVQPAFGEGVYIGTAGGSDRSDENRIIGNEIGPGVRAENVDIKEGTTGGIIRGNTFDGSDLQGANSADSWVDVKGNGYLIEDNIGRKTLTDGFQTHVLAPGWGDDNVFARNRALVDAPGYGFAIHTDSTRNIVRCDNAVTGAGKGLANVSCTP